MNVIRAYHDTPNTPAQYLFGDPAPNEDRVMLQFESLSDRLEAACGFFRDTMATISTRLDVILKTRWGAGLDHYDKWLPLHANEDGTIQFEFQYSDRDGVETDEHAIPKEWFDCTPERLKFFIDVELNGQKKAEEARRAAADADAAKKLEERERAELARLQEKYHPRQDGVKIIV